MATIYGCLTLRQVSPAGSFADLQYMAWCDTEVLRKPGVRLASIVSSPDFVHLLLGQSGATVSRASIPRPVNQLIRHVFLAGCPTQVAAIPAHRVMARMGSIQPWPGHGSIERSAREDVDGLQPPLEPDLTVGAAVSVMAAGHRLVRPYLALVSDGHQIGVKERRNLTVLSPPGHGVAIVVLRSLVVRRAPAALEGNYRCRAVGHRADRSILGHVAPCQRPVRGRCQRRHPDHLSYRTAS